ncbi:hypothetical protein [Alicycliphilus denitrificans]
MSNDSKNQATSFWKVFTPRTRDGKPPSAACPARRTPFAGL